MTRPNQGLSTGRRENLGTRLRECVGHHRDSISELIFLFFSETVGYWTLLVNLVVSLRLYLRLSYKLGTDHFGVEEMLWSPCAFIIHSN